MRMFSHSLLLGLVSIGLASRVDASCQGGPSDTDIPDANALTLFVTSASAGVLNGDFPHWGHTATTPDMLGLDAADHICTYIATNPSGTTLTTQAASHSTTQPYYNQDANGNTVAFRAILSTNTINAIDRFADISNINIVDAKTRKCLASNIHDLFSGSDGFGYVYTNGNLFTETGQTLSINTQVWTGTGAIFTDSSKTTANIPGGSFHANGQSIDSAHGFCYNSATNQPWTSSDVDVNGAIGIIVDSNTGPKAPNTWIYDTNTPNGLACSQGVRLYCLSGQAFNPPTPTPNVGGDPQFVGLQGQSFQVHGMPDEFFNLITTPEFQLNSRFTYLASGTCNYNNTECWTHPGTYVDQLGFMFPGIAIKTIAGSHEKGLRVWMNDDEMRIHTKLKLTTTNENNTTQTVIVRHPHHDVLIVSSTLFTVEITNSDWFFNFNLQFHLPEILTAGRPFHQISDIHAVDTFYPSYPMHGLIGQTWKNARYPGKRMYVGEIDDYMLTDHQLFSIQFGYNLYTY